MAVTSFQAAAGTLPFGTPFSRLDESCSQSSFFPGSGLEGLDSRWKRRWKQQIGGVFLETRAVQWPPQVSCSADRQWGAAVGNSLYQSNLILPNAPTLTNAATLTLAVPQVECLEVTGGYGLEGRVRISGAKNSALAVLAGALCCEEPVVLRMVPDLHDIKRMKQVLESVGATVKRGHDGSDSCVLVDASHLTSVEPCPDVVRKLRASFFVLGPLLARMGKAVVPLPGGCNIGARPIDLHTNGLRALGAEVERKQGKIYAYAKNGRRLVGGNVHMDFPSVGATETIIMGAVLAEGETTITNGAQEPEVRDLADFLNACGARIRFTSNNTICIQGVHRLHSAEFTVIPDRIEAGTFLTAAAITRSTISIAPVFPTHLAAVIGKLQAIGCRIGPDKELGPHSVKIECPPNLRCSEINTLPFPGFPTDMQPQLMALLTTCSGTSHITENVFESRMRHAEELQKLGAKIIVKGKEARVYGQDGGSSLYGVEVEATDLRAGAALVLAGLAAEGRTHIQGLHHVDRGYEQFDRKLRGLGAHIQRLPCTPVELQDVLV